jgi:hypothetical protein
MRITELANLMANPAERKALLDLAEDCPDLLPDDLEVPEHLVLPFQNHARSLAAARSACLLREIKEMRKMGEPGALRRWFLVGDIAHPGRICVVAYNLDEALDKANQGEFVVFDEQNDCLAFDWNGDEDSIETEDM